ncbi:MAG: hypothetical protein LBE36_08400 [Flavobacteriaceae bacterium]|jgi:hypothetical protein|nr:hypothetical protein [Flavobacteriaceae bacterium]
MKRTIFLTALILFSVQSYAQQEKENYLEPNDIIGTWQQDYNIVGAGLLQNFVFSKDGTFVLNLANPKEDVRMLVGLKGKYRLVKDSLYFTITSRIVLEGGNIEIGGLGMDFYVFYIDDGTLKEIPEENPQELEPCYITVFDKKHIKINNEEYYKIDEKDLE